MIFNNLKILIKSHPIVLILFLFLQICAFVSIITAYCQYSEKILESQDYHREKATITIECCEKNYEYISEYIKDTQENACDSGIKTIRVFLDSENEIPIVYLALGKDYVIGNGKNFSKNEEPEIILALKSFYEMNTQIGDYVRINEKEVKVIGTYNINDYSSINRCFIDDNTKIEKVEIVFDHLPSKNDIEQFNNFTYSYLSECTINNPSQRNIITEMSFDSEYFSSVLLLAFAILSFSYIYTYFLSQREYLFSIYRSNGCSIARMFRMCMFEYIIFYILSMASSLVIFHGYIKKLLFSNMISFYDYIIPVISCFLISFVIITLQTKLYLNKSMISLIKGGE